MIQTSQITLTSGVRTLIASPGADSDGFRIVIYNETHGGHYCAIGDAFVTVENGVHLYGGDRIELYIEGGEALYAIAAETIDLRLLKLGVRLT